MAERTRCPGSGMQMISRSYIVRKIEHADRAKNDLWIKHAEERGDVDEAAAVRDSFAVWEKEQGFTRERLACAVCGNAWLSPTSKGSRTPSRRRSQQTDLGRGAAAARRH